MKKTLPFILSLALCIITAQGVRSGSAAESTASPAKLAEGNWDTFNLSAVNAFIAAHGRTSPSYDAKKPPYAVFDWDNTMSFLDTEEAVLIYQLEHLLFRMTPAQMSVALRKDVPAGDFTKDYNNAAGEPVNVGKAADDAVKSYTWLYANYKGLKGKLSLEEVRKHPEYTDFITKVRYLYEAIGDTFDVSVSYPWVLYLFTGMNAAQVEDITRKTVEWQLTQPIEKVKWTSPAELPGKAGVVSVSWKNGFRTVPEMKDLFRAFREAGIDIWICSASFVDVIREISSDPAFGYGNSPDRVLAMELDRDSRGLIRTAFRKGYDQTQGKGKTKAIERFLVSKYGYGPVFIAGDSEGDQNMMQDFPSVNLVLIINRLKGKDIAKLSKIAVDSYGKADAKILLQGRDDNAGTFVRSQIHYKLGSTEGKALK